MPGHLPGISETVSGRSHLPCSAINLTLYVPEGNKVLHPVDFVTKAPVCRAGPWRAMWQTLKWDAP